MNPALKLFEELKRRNVLRVAAAYIVLAWLIIQVVETIFPVFAVSDALIRLIIILLAIGLIPVSISAWVFELTPEGIKKENEVDRGKHDASQTGKKLDRLIIATLAIAVTYFAVDKFVISPAREESIAKTAREAGRSEGRLGSLGSKTIAVLPFVNMSGDAEQEYFSDGLSEEILLVLTRIPDVVVASRTSAFAYRGSNRNIREIAAELRVNYIIEGSVRRAGDNVRITANLVDTANDVQLWSNSYDRKLIDVFEIQDQTARAIGDALKIQLADSRGNQLRASGTSDLAAHDLYLKGRYLLHKRGIDNVRRAIDLFEEVTILDPEFAEAHASIAIAKSIGWGQRDAAGAMRSANRAIELNPQLPMALLAGALAARGQFRIDDMEQMLREVIELEPGNARPMHFLGIALSQTNRMEEARQSAARAVTLDPGAAMYRVWLGNHLMALDRLDEGLAHLDAAIEIDAAVYPMPFMWKVVTKNSSDALEIVKKAVADGVMTADDEAYCRAFTLAFEGRLEEAQRTIVGRPTGVANAVYIPLFIALGDVEKANEIIETAFANGVLWPELRDLGRFAPAVSLQKTRYFELLASVGLAESNQQ